MADVFWEHCDYPVRCAITAACLLREMAKKDFVEPAVKMSMLANATHFEEKAIGVMKHMQRVNRQGATMALDCQLRLYTGMTLLDLAVKGNCGKFIEECCEEAIGTRMYGDINPYVNSTAWILFNAFPLCGLLAAFDGYCRLKDRTDFIRFKIPPVDENIRGSTQRRVRPQGYPYMPHLNQDLRDDDPVPRQVASSSFSLSRPA